MNHLTVHIALDDQTIENGCLHYIPGSHKWKKLPITSRHFNDMESIKTQLTTEELEQFKPVPMLLKKGQIAFHHPLTIHGSFQNNTDHPRRATVLNFFADNTLSNSDQEMLGSENVSVIKIKKGDKMDGKFFPLLYSK